MPFWTREREAGVWDFKVEVDNSQVDEEEQTYGKRILIWPTVTMGHGKESNRFVLGFSPSATLPSYYDAKVIVPFL